MSEKPGSACLAGLRNVALAPLVLAMAACASYEPSTVAVPQPTASQWVVLGDFAAAAEPYVDPEQQQAIFDADFDEADVIAIQVVVENRGKTSKLVRPSDIVLELPDGQKLPPATVATTVTKVGEDGSVVGSALAFGVIGAIVAANAENEARAARTQDYQGKALQVSALNKNDQAHGFVFFIPPRGTQPFDEGTLHVRFADTADSTSQVVELPLTGISYEEEVEEKPAPRDDSTGS